MISVDPGVGGTGWAVWKLSDTFKTGNLINYGVLHYKNTSSNWIERTENIVLQFNHLLDIYLLSEDTVVIEFPNFMQGSGGRMVAVRGDLVKLSVLTGMLMTCILAHKATVQIVSPVEWKGQLPKWVAASRVRKILKSRIGNKKISEHAMDAIGIGLWAEGRF
jgi:Holliday junction resolvasome RuvABC endonuclease subunit